MSTFVAIATVTVGSGGASSIEFTSIPQTFTDLQLLVSARDNDGGNGSAYNLSFNGTGWGGNRELYFYNGNLSTGITAGELAGNGNGSTASIFGNASVYIPAYTGNKSKMIISDSVAENNNNNNVMLVFHSGSSGVTAAITSITIGGSGVLFLQHSTATLYGIKNS
jgi:hypothetical protein